jgi:ribosome-associated heat shock protein Hsp15
MKTHDHTAHTVISAMRLDKWLKAARIFKTREEAAQACDLGRVKVNDHVAKPSREVRVGDVLVVKATNHYRTLEIKELPTRGLSAKDAKLVYHETTPELPPETVELMKLFKEQARQLPTPEKGRPTKKSRREMERWRGKV